MQRFHSKPLFGAQQKVNFVKKLERKIIFSALLFLAPSISAKTNSKEISDYGHSYICQFGKYGTVTIDTRYPGASITINGVHHDATGGSYFYQTVDGELAIAFNPKMTIWTYMDSKNPSGIIDARCRKIKNIK